MPRDKTANHIKLMAAARAEFLELGYENASMRSIAQRCGMTAPGLYRHCRDKADLFEQVVSPAVERVDAWLAAHISHYVEALHGEEPLSWQDSEIDMMREVIYPNMEDYHLLLAKSRGTRYENYLHDMTQRHQEDLRRFLPMLRQQGYDVWDIDPQELHLLLTAYTAALFEPVVHNYPQEDALRCLKTVEAFFLPGWKQLLGF